jgi:hypothetical protein
LPFSRRCWNRLPGTGLCSNDSSSIRIIQV